MTATVINFPGSDSVRPLPRLRLTARGRFVFTALAAVPVVLVAMMVSLNGGGAIASGDAAPLEYMTVEYGQSLWAIDEGIAPEADPRDVIADVLDLNGLTTASVQPGQQLAIPAKYNG